MRRHNAGRLLMTFTAIASVLVTSCVQRPQSALDGMRSASTIPALERAGFAVNSMASAKRIARSELDSLDVNTVADAIMRLRPTWLRVDGTDPLLRDVTPSVYVNDMFAGGPDELRLIPLERAAEVQFLTASNGFDRFGHSCQCSRGVILVITRRQ